MARGNSEADQQVSSACDAAKSLLRRIRIIREGATLAGQLSDGKDWLQTAAELSSSLLQARADIEPMLPRFRAATMNMGPVQCGHLAAPTAHKLVLKLGEHAVTMVKMATNQSRYREGNEDNVYDYAVELAREIGVPPIESWNLLEARLQCEAQSTVPVTDKADNGSKQSQGATSDKRKKKATINERMMGTITENQEAMGWNSPQWARYLKCGKSTVVATPAWKLLGDHRGRAKAERMTDRRRKPKASDRRRD